MHKSQFGTEVLAELKRVVYEGTDTIYEGALLSYNYDTTDNILGYDKGAGGHPECQSTPSTTADGNQNEGKFLRVEQPTTTNAPFFAGVVAPGSWCGTTGSGYTELEIYVANGAMVPVRCNKSITVLDEMFITNEAYTASDAGTYKIAIAAETVDRSSTSGLVLARLSQPQLQNTVATTSTIGYTEAIWGEMHLEELRRNPSAGILYETDYLGTDNLVTAETCVLTQTTTGTIAMDAEEGGAVKLDTAGHTTADDGLEVQFTQCRVKPAAGRMIGFEARVKMNDATDQYYVGLAGTDTTILPAGAMDDAVDKCGFVHLAASTDNKISSITARTSADDLTADVAANTDGTYMTVGFLIDGLSSVKFYVNGSLVETCSTAANIPNAEMCLTYVTKTEGTDADAEMTVDMVRVGQYGGRS